MSQNTIHNLSSSNLDANVSCLTVRCPWIAWVQSSNSTLQLQLSSRFRRYHDTPCAHTLSLRLPPNTPQRTSIKLSGRPSLGSPWTPPRGPGAAAQQEFQPVPLKSGLAKPPQHGAMNPYASKLESLGDVSDIPLNDGTRVERHQDCRREGLPLPLVAAAAGISHRAGMYFVSDGKPTPQGWKDGQRAPIITRVPVTHMCASLMVTEQSNGHPLDRLYEPGSNLESWVHAAPLQCAPLALASPLPPLLQLPWKCATLSSAIPSLQQLPKPAPTHASRQRHLWPPQPAPRPRAALHRILRPATRPSPRRQHCQGASSQGDRPATILLPHLERHR
jgi:hypothetical protein